MFYSLHYTKPCGYVTGLFVRCVVRVGTLCTGLVPLSMVRVGILCTVLVPLSMVRVGAFINGTGWYLVHGFGFFHNGTGQAVHTGLCSVPDTGQVTLCVTGWEALYGFASFFQYGSVG